MEYLLDDLEIFENGEVNHKKNHINKEIIGDDKQTNDHQSRVKKRIFYNRQQLKILEYEYFINDGYVSRHQRNLLARDLGISSQRIKTWFQNRRAKEKRQSIHFQTCNFNTQQSVNFVSYERPQSFISPTCSAYSDNYEECVENSQNNIFYPGNNAPCFFENATLPLISPSYSDCSDVTYAGESYSNFCNQDLNIQQSHNYSSNNYVFAYDDTSSGFEDYNQDIDVEDNFNDLGLEDLNQDIDLEDSFADLSDERFTELSDIVPSIFD